MYFCVGNSASLYNLACLGVIVQISGQIAVARNELSLNVVLDSNRNISQPSSYFAANPRRCISFENRPGWQNINASAATPKS